MTRLSPPWNAVLLMAALSPCRAGTSERPSVLDDVAVPQAADAGENLQRSIDRAARSRGTVRLVAGVYLVSKPLVLPSYTTIVGAGMDRTIIRNLGRFPRPVLEFGRKEPVKNISLQDFCVEQMDNDQGGTNCLHGDQADDVRLTRIRARGSRYEGIVGGGHARRWTLEECEAHDCGNGGPAYSLSTAGINVTSCESVLSRCKTRRCGQGFEFGNRDVHLLDCSVAEPTSASPSIAFNCGSAVLGVSKVEVVRCRSSGYKEALTIGNGIGRLSAVAVAGCTFVDGSISFAGGKPKNTVPTRDEGPDTSGSSIRDCVVRWTNPSDKTPSALLYNTGPSPSGKVLGREPLVVERLHVQFASKATARLNDPVFGVAGHVSAPVTFRECVVDGLDEPPVRGDGAVFANNDNALPDDVSHLRFVDCTATTFAGAARAFDTRIPKPPKKQAPAKKRTKRP